MNKVKIYMLMLVSALTFKITGIDKKFDNFALLAQMKEKLNSLRSSTDNTVKALREEQDDFLRKITSEHTRSFSRDNLIANKIDAGEKRKWNDLLYSINTYIKKSNNRDLIPVIESLKKVSDKLFSFLENTYKKYIEPTLTDKKKGLSGTLDKLNICAVKNRATLEQEISNFLKNTKYQETVPVLLNSFQKKIDIKKFLNNKNYASQLHMTAGQLYQMVVLSDLAFRLELTVTKLGNDMKRINALATENKCK